MKKFALLFIKLLFYPILISVSSSLLSFQKQADHVELIDKSPLASSYTSQVLDKWMSMQIFLMSNTPAIFNGPFVRIFSYTSLAAYESIYPGISKTSPYRFSPEKLNQMPAMPAVEEGKKYYWPCSLNSALAFMNRSMFSSASATNKSVIDSLENAMKIAFANDADEATLRRSSLYGLQVAQRIFSWAETDGYLHASDAYTPPAGPGKWKPTPPNFAKPVTPYWGNLRTIVTGSIDNAQPPAPIPYSEDTSSAFYKEVKSVYEISQHLSEDQKDIALFWKEINPGITAPGHWLNILRQVIQQDKVTLDRGAFAYALSGMALNDAWICCWKTRYVYNLLRPVTYIREVMKHSEWLSFVPTPPHPEYTSGFAAMAGAVCEVLATIFGNEYQFMDHTYDYTGMKPRKYYSFEALAKEAGESKWLGGIHYRFSVEAGLQEGKMVAKNVVKLTLEKDPGLKQ
jgi:hypothetical protein